MLNPIKILLVEDQFLVREGIIQLLALNEELQVVDSACDGEEAIEKIIQHTPDIVLMDIRMPKLTGIEVLTYFYNLDPNTLPKTILLTTFDDDEYFLQGIKWGAKGFLLKDVSLELLIEAIHTVLQGDTMYRPGLTERVIRTLRKQATPDAKISEKLTVREIEVLRLIAGGYSNREISSILGISEGVVKNYSSSIFVKIDARDRTNAVLKGIELGFI